MRRNPDTLTARESEVLGLIRRGLTNEEIAQGLDISLDGAKYHVSQILSKLGVASREEAAAVALGERRRWWAAWPVWAKIAGTATVAAAVAGLAVLMWGLLRSESEAETPLDLQGLAVDEVYRRALDSASRPGSVLHTTITYAEATLADGEKVTPMTEMWFDADDDAARRHSVGISEGEYDEYDDLIIRKYIYSINPPINPGQKISADRDNFAQHCPGSDSAVIALLFLCPGDPIEGESSSPRSIEVRDFEGRGAIALVSTGSFGGGAGRLDFTTTLYLDPETSLPRAMVFDGFRPFGASEGIARYQHEYLDREEVGADYFDPRSVGYGVQNVDQLLGSLAANVPVYWLGEEIDFESSACSQPGGECHLVLDGVEKAPDDGSSGVLGYRGGITISLWTPENWANRRPERARLLEEGRCVERSREVSLEGVHATIYGPPRPSYPLPSNYKDDPCLANFDGSIIAVADFGDAVGEVTAHVTSYYNTIQSTESVLRSIKRR